MSTLSANIKRTDAYLGVLAIVISNNMAAMDETSPNNGYDLDGAPYGGATDPVWIGVTQQGLAVLAWYVSKLALANTLIELINGIVNDASVDIYVPTLIFFAGTIIYHMSIVFQDVCYWFNMFVTDGVVEKIPEREGLLNYVVTEIPTASYVVFVFAYAYHVVRLYLRKQQKVTLERAVVNTPLPARIPSLRQSMASHTRR